MLQQGVKASKNAQPFAGQILVAVVRTQLTFDQIHKRRVAGIGQAAAQGHVQRFVLGVGRFLLTDHALLGHQIQYQVTPCGGAFRVAARVVVGGALDHPYQQRNLMQLQLLQRLGKVILTGQAKAVHCAVAVLTEEYLIEVGLEDFFLAVMQLQQHRHHGLKALADNVAISCQVKIFHQLLGQGTAALTQAAAGQVDEHGAGNALGRHAKMLEELAIFHCHQRVHQIRRSLIQTDQNTVFVMSRVNAADHQRFKPRHDQVLGATNTGDAVTVKTHAYALRLLGALEELEPAGIDINTAAAHRHLPRPIGRVALPIAQGLQLGEEIVAAQWAAGIQLQRARKDLGRHRPALAGKLLLHDGIKIDRQSPNQHQTDQPELEQPAPEATATAGLSLAPRLGLAFVSHVSSRHYPSDAGMHSRAALCYGWPVTRQTA